MRTLAEIEEAADLLPRKDKLRLMETLWSELSRTEAELDSPAWHGTVLKETERRLAEGREEVLDWSHAKAGSRKRTV